MQKYIRGTYRYRDTLFNGTDTEKAKLKRITNQNRATCQSIYDGLLSGEYAVAYQATVGPCGKSLHVFHICGRGVQMSAFFVRNGKITPMMHVALNEKKDPIQEMKSYLVRGHVNIRTNRKKVST